MTGIKAKIKAAAEIALDAFLDNAIPYKMLSKTRLKNLSVPSCVPLHYIFNQKIQRLQILDMLYRNGIDNPPKIKAWWSRGLSNFGDELLAYLLANIAGYDCVYDRKKNLVAIGSIVRFAEDHSSVWGSGIIRKNEPQIHKPTCLAVRGPLTREKLLEDGVDCPAIYGDPAMLFPLFYKPRENTAASSDKTVIVPHFKHTHLMPQHDDFRYVGLHVHSIYDIEHIIDAIATAPRVVTSSLHGFIFCVAYGIPVTVFKRADKNIGGDNIKFDDFCAGVGLDPITIHTLDNDSSKNLATLADKAQIYKPDWSAVPLLESLSPLCGGVALDAFIKRAQSLGTAV